MAATVPTILQIIPRLDTGGAELTTLEISEAVTRAGGRMIVVTEGGRMVEAARTAGAQIVLMPAGTKSPLGLIANARALTRLIAAEGVHLVHARSRAPAWSALRAARAAGVAFVTTYHGAYAEKGPIKRLYNSVMARGDRVIANSAYTADLVRARYATPPSRIRIVHRGVEVALFDPAAISAARCEALARTWGVAEGDRVVLQAARLTGWKGQRVVIDAVARLVGQGQGQGQGRSHRIVAILAGDDQGRSGYREDLTRQIADLGLADCVRLVGHCSDMPAAFALAAVAVVASTEPEAFGRTATEAQAAGCPVIATAIGAPPETVLAAPAVDPSQSTGWLVPPGNATALAEALGAAMALSPEARAHMGAIARAHVAQRFSLEGMKGATLAVYDEVLGTDLARAFAQAPRPPQHR